jgi:hypothetical protein
MKPDSIERGVGGWFERVEIRMGADLWCNETGRLQRLFPNWIASKLVEDFSRASFFGSAIDCIPMVGDCVVTGGGAEPMACPMPVIARIVQLRSLIDGDRSVFETLETLRKEARR